ncbi:MAG: RNA-binding protein [Saprospiraceae bacterium]|nr:RNA-binding protein [Saprospiraceae bacterium]
MNIFVAKMSFDTSQEQLRSLFESYGAVDSVKIVYDKETGRSKGYGFVEMAEESDGLEAIKELNETELDGRTIVVKKAEARPQGGERRGGGGYGGGGGGNRSSYGNSKPRRY